MLSSKTRAFAGSTARETQPGAGPAPGATVLGGVDQHRYRGKPTGERVNSAPGKCGHADRGVRVLITVDTEPDDAWQDHLCPSVRNVAALKRLDALLRRFGARATLLVTYRVIQDRECVELLRRLVSESGAEVGAHLHPWESPPFLEDGSDVKHPIYPQELPVGVFAQKLARLTEAISDRVGRPTSYRAGRWGIAPEHVRVLEELGYEVDSSVMPLKNWNDTPGVPFAEQGSGGVDFRLAPRIPYRLGYADITRPGDARLLEVPVTVGFKRPVSAAFARRCAHLPDLAQRLLRRTGILRPVWAAPAWESEEDLLDMICGVCREGLPVVNLIFHSSEFTVNSLPECDTPEKVDAIFRRTEMLLERLSNCDGCEFTTLTAAARRCGESAPPCAATSAPGLGLSRCETEGRGSCA